MNPALQGQLLTCLLGVCAIVALFLGVAAIVGVIDGRRQARERREYAESDFWRTAHAKPEPRKRVS